jgi:hypothetical protein
MFKQRKTKAFGAVTQRELLLLEGLIFGKTLERVAYIERNALARAFVDARRAAMGQACTTQELASVIEDTVRGRGFYAGLGADSVAPRIEEARKASARQAELDLSVDRDRRLASGLPSYFDRRAECWVHSDGWVAVGSVDGHGRQSFHPQFQA